MTSVLHFLTILAPLLALGVQLMLSPTVTPIWMTLKQPWPRLIGAGLSIVGTTVAAHAAGDDWASALQKGMAGLMATGILGHGLTPGAAKPEEKPEEKKV